VWGLGCGVWGLGFGVWGVGCGVWGVGCGVWGLRFGVWVGGYGVGLWGLGYGFNLRLESHQGVHELGVTPTKGRPMRVGYRVYTCGFGICLGFKVLGL
jgi:hypothetical protein